MYTECMKCQFEESFRSLKLDYSILSFGTFLDQHEILSLNNKQQIMSIQPFVYSLAFTFKENKSIFSYIPCGRNVFICWWPRHSYQLPIISRHTVSTTLQHLL